jgi:ribonucleoside-triphosphate reductase
MYRTIYIFMTKCDKNTEVYSRVVGYYRPVQQWNIGKAQEFEDRKVFKPRDNYVKVRSV